MAAQRAVAGALSPAWASAAALAGGGGAAADVVAHFEQHEWAVLDNVLRPEAARELLPCKSTSIQASSLKRIKRRASLLSCTEIDQTGTNLAIRP